MSNYAVARAASKRRKLAHPLPPPSATPSTTDSKSKSKNKSTVLSSRPAARTRTERASNLAWKNVVLPSEFGLDEEGGLLELEEVEGVEVVYGEGLVAFRVKDEMDVPLGEQIEEPLTKSQKKARKALARAALAEAEQEEDEVEPSPFGEEDAEEVDGISPFGEEEEPSPFAEEEEPSPFDPESEVELEMEVAGETEAVKEKVKKVKVQKAKVEVIAPATLVEASFDVEKLLPNWSHLPLPIPLYRALHELKFNQPTAIQERALSVEIGAMPFIHPEEAEEEEEWGGITDDLPPSVSIPKLSKKQQRAAAVIPVGPIRNTLDRDLVGVAQTGSGKTLAYGLPILSFILSSPAPSAITDLTADYSRLAALILAPTRELALQVRAALSEVAIRTNPVLSEELQDPNVNAPRKRERGRHVSVVALTGGMSVEKQKRQLSRGADILVATPGRLWDLIKEDDDLAKAIKGIKFLVIDEADRMIENGHFAELENIVRLTRRHTSKREDPYIDDFMADTAKHSIVNTIKPREAMRTFVFSATMSKDLQRNLKKHHRKYAPGPAEDGMSSLDDLLLKLDFRDPDPELIDLSPDGGLVETLKECKVECMLEEKDIHLYHFLLRYPGRTIVFLSSIDGIRRLHPLMVLLGLNVVALHSGMQQRARLKSLDRFKSSPTSILLATDVAARGLDIPSVSHVLHYQLPRSADVYVHRSGRTARAGAEGLAVQLVAPEEKQMQRLLMASLGKGVDLPSLPTDFSIMDKLKERIDLAKRIESTMHKASKEAHEDNWVRQAAEAMDIEIDSDMDFSDAEESGTKKSRKELKSKAAKVKILRAELQAMLDKPLMMRGLSAKYITTRGRVGFVDQLAGGTNHSMLLGVEKSSALADLPVSKKRKAVPLL